MTQGAVTLTTRLARSTTGLIEKGVFEGRIIPRELRAGLHILKSRYVLAFKNVGTADEKKGARLVVTAIRRPHKGSADLFTHSPTTTKAAMRILFSLSVSLDTPLYTRDVSQAFICSKYEVLRDFWIVPPKEANRHPDALWLLKEPLYGLPESGKL
jgi:hypothetical protein